MRNVPAGRRQVSGRLGLLAGLVVCALLGFGPAAASAASAIGVTTAFPATVAVGATGVSAEIVVTNQNTAPDGATTICNAGDGGACTGATGITLIPSCSQLDAFGCSPAGADPNVFALATGATGAAGSACPGREFTVSVVDATFGTVRIAPTTGSIVLPAGAACRIALTFSVLKLPADAQPAIGLQTRQHVAATAVSDFAETATSTGSGTVTVKLAPPAQLATDPTSPANNNAPKVKGTAPAGAELVSVYSGAACDTTLVTASPAAFTSPGLTVSVLDNTTTTFSATATDSAGGVSACSPTTISYAEVTPTAPQPAGSTPASPANDNAPRITGTAPAGSTVRLYANTSCIGTPAGQGSAAAFASPGLTVAVFDDSPTTFYATSTDDATGIKSACSTTSFTYVEDSTPPSVPPPGGTTPASPANDNAPRVTGSATRESIIRVYTAAGCAGAVAATGTAAALASPGLAVSVSDNSTTSFYVTATDAAGNESACSSPANVYVEDSAPPETVIDSGPDGAGASSTPTFTFSSNEAGARFECRADTADFAACRSPFTAATLANGPHTFDVRAIDAAGNVDPTAARRTFAVGGPAAPPPAADAPPRPVCAGVGGVVYTGTTTGDEGDGTSGTDIMFGLGGRDILRGEAGPDCLYGGRGADRLLGGSGDDRLFGDAGNDELDGGVGRDNLRGGTGSDRLTDRRGRDRFSGGGGNDRIDARDASQKDRGVRDRILCGPGTDTVLVDPSDSIARDCERRRITRRR